MDGLNHLLLKGAAVFAIAINQNQYKTYILSDQLAQTRLEVVPERGGIITAWSVRGQEMLYLDAARFADPTLSVRGGIPILFPICGNLPDNTYQFDEQPYSLKQHGFARDLPWDVTDRTTQEQVSITLSLQSNEQTRSLYPFEFQLNFTYRLQGNSLELDQEFVNLGDRPMPFSTGLHPYFGVTDKRKLQFDIPAAEFQSHKDYAYAAFSNQFDFEQDEIDVIFPQPSRHQASVTDLERGIKLDLDYSALYSKLVFWTLKGKPFYCLEPWSAPRNALNTGDGLTLLPPKQSLKTLVRLTANFI
jgi:galactose mutarotase-like enzyme